MPYYMPDDVVNDLRSMRFGSAAKDMMNSFGQKIATLGRDDQADAAPIDSSPSYPLSTPSPAITAPFQDTQTEPAAPPTPPPQQQQQQPEGPIFSRPAQQQGNSSSSSSTESGFKLPTLDELTAPWKSPKPQEAPSQTAQPQAAQSQAASAGASSGGTSLIPSLESLTSLWTKPSQQQAGVVTPSGTPSAMPTIAQRATLVDAQGRPISVSYGAGQQNDLGPVAGGNKADFLRTAGPIAAQVEAETGVPAKLSLAVAANETGWGNPQYVVGNNYHGIHAVGDQPSVQSSDHDAQGRPYTVGYRKFDNPAEGFRGFANFLLENPRYKSALAQYKQDGDLNALITNIAVPHTVNGEQQGGYAEDPAYARKVQALMSEIPDQPKPAQRPASVTVEGKPPSTVLPAPPPPHPGTLTPNQLTEGTDAGLDYSTALSICGPAAAVAFARANGGAAPTLKQAYEMAKARNLWDLDNGMHGPESEAELMRGLGVRASVDWSVDWNRVRSELRAGRPVTISTPGHYFVAESLNPDGSIDFGNSARVLRASGGKSSLRPEDIPSLGMGDARAAIYMGGAN